MMTEHVTTADAWSEVEGCVAEHMAQPAFGELPAVPGFAEHARSFGVPVGGFTLRVADGDAAEPLYQRSFGGWDGTEVVPLASASKLPAMAAIMTIVEEGGLSLDTTVAELFPQHGGTPTGSIVLSQLMSHTSGIVPQHEVFADTTITLAESAEAILDLPLQNPPGTAFAYGGCGMHVAGRMAEMVDGRPWRELFAERLGDVLGATTWDYSGGTNPRVPGGLSSSIEDYDRVLRMMAGRGRVGDRQVLAPSSVEEMWTNRWHGDKVEWTAIESFIGYGLGQWIEGTTDGTRAGTPTIASCGGAFGAIPWLDRETSYRAVFLMLGTARYAHQIWEKLHPLVANAVRAEREARSVAASQAQV